MKSKVFSLDTNSSTTTYDEIEKLHSYKFNIPILSAYAIEYFTLQYGALSVFPLNIDRIDGNILSVSAGYSLDELDCKLVIFHQGVRDYKMLFPYVAPETLQARLGEFYKEAELAFNSGAWMSFILMCGALFEGLLFYKTGKNDTFKNLIKRAFEEGKIDSYSFEILNKVREYRNLVHANKHTLSYVSRADAMDTRIILDRLILEA